jgi:glycosyltransferase involved in cell wall biosynthesis
MEVVFVDWTPIKNKSEITSGGHVRRFYAWTTLNEMVDKVVPLRKSSGSLNWEGVRGLVNKKTKIWVEYGSGRIAHILVLLGSFISSKGFILNVHDFVIQHRYFDKDTPFLKKIQLQILERMLLRQADVIILPCSGFLDFIDFKKYKKILIMPPGIGADELSYSKSNRKNKYNISLYFGGMKRERMISEIIELYSNFKEWELHLVGNREGEIIPEKNNVKYLGAIGHDKLKSILGKADIILIPLPKNIYFDKSIPMKIGYALMSCKPIISTRLRGITEYVKTVGLESNIIYLEEWDNKKLKEATQKARNIKIDPEKTIKNLKKMAWEPRFKKAVDIALKGSQSSDSDQEFIFPI